MSTIKFKSGDTVRRTWGVNKGDICVVKEAHAIGITLEGNAGSYDPEFFELVDKPVTVEVCYRLCVYDSEICQLKSQLDNMREEHKRKEAELEEKIKDTTVKLDALKAEYNIV